MRVDPHKVLTLANEITIARVLCVPVFILVLVYYILDAADGSANEVLRWAALVLFAATALSDAVDGYFARSRDEITRLGTFLDPLADKTLLLSAIILLGRPSAKAFTPHIPVWILLLLISRDSLLVIGAMLIHAITGHVHVRPRMSGKASTFFQMLMVTWVLAGLSERGFNWIIGGVGFFTSLSALQYLIDGVRQLEGAQPAKADAAGP